MRDAGSGAAVRIGETVSHYRIVAHLGGGGMGVVYRAEDLRLKRPVALKFLPADLTRDPEANERFILEAQAASALDHANLCTIHEIDRTDDGRLYIAMAFYQGETLKKRLERGRLAPTEAVGIAIQIAQGLERAHEAGIIHRDIKPANLLVTARGEVKIVDFGLAKLAGQATVTATGTTLGTPAYMSPEQARGGEVDPRTDIWSLGVVLFEMVTGRRPFRGEDGVAIVHAILHEAPPRPSALVPGLRPEEESVILRCLERDPLRRFLSAPELLRALRALDAEADLTLTTPRPRRGRADRRRLRWPLAVAGLLLAAAAGLLWRSTLAPGDGGRPAGEPAAIAQRRSVAVLGFRNLTDRAEADWLSTALAEMLTTELALGERLRTVPGETVSRARLELSLADAETLAEDSLAALRDLLGADYVVLGSFVALGEGEGGRLRLDLRLQDAVSGETIAATPHSGTEAELFDLVAQAGADLRGRLGVEPVADAEAAAALRATLPDEPEAARAYGEGLAHLRRFEATEARAALERATAMAPDFALAHAALAAALSALGYDREAAAAAERAFAFAGDLPRQERLSVEARHRELAGDGDRALEIYGSLWTFFPDDLEHGLRLAEAQVRWRKAEEAERTIAALRSLPAPASLDPRIDLAEVVAAAARGDHARALAAAERAIATGEAQGASIVVARARLNQALALNALGRPDEAELACAEARRLYEAAGDSGGVAQALNNLGMVLFNQGDLSSTQGIFEEALAVHERTGNRRGMARAANNIAVALDAQGRRGEARQRYEQALALYREIGDRNGEAIALGNIALVLRNSGELAAAGPLYEEALATFRELGNRGSVAWTLNSLALVRAETGDLGRAQTLLEECLAIRRELGEKAGISQALNNLAGLALHRGEPAGSFSLNEESLALARESEHQFDVAYALSGLGQALFALGRLEEARTRHEAALAIRQELGERVAALESRLSLARIALESGQAAAAEQVVREVLTDLQPGDSALLEAAVQRALAAALVARGRPDEALPAGRRAAELLDASAHLDARLAAAPEVARPRAAAGRRDEALSRLAAAGAAAAAAGFVDYAFEIELAAAELEFSGGGEAAVGRLVALQQRARTAGFGLVERRAAAAAEGRGSEG